jgi:O-antigen/teichoic acid export membrane protein
MSILGSILSKFKSSFQHQTEGEISLVKAILWNFIGNGIGKLSIVTSSILVARHLGPEIFGKWAIIRSTTAMFTILLGFGVAVTTVKYLAEYRESEKEKAGNIIGIAISFALVLGLILASVNFLTSTFVGEVLIKDASIVKALQLSSWFLFFLAINGVISGGLAGLNCFSAIAKSNLISGLLGTPIIIYFSYHNSLYGIVTGFLSYYILTFIALTYFFQKKLREDEIKISFKKYKENVGVILNHNVPAILSGGIGGCVVWLVSIYVARLNSGFSILGINDAAKIAQNTIMEISAQIDLPIISYLSSTNDSSRKNKINLYIPLVLCTLIIFPLIYFPDLILVFFNNSQFKTEEFSIVFSLSLLTTYIMIYKRGMGRTIITKNFMWWGVYENMFWATLLATFIYLFVADYGSVGFALAFTLAYLIDLMAITPFYFKKGLINKSIAFSTETIIIWIIVISGPILIYLEADQLTRIIVFSIFSVISFICLKRILRNFDSV